jgi:hypothetical protein
MAEKKSFILSAILAARFEQGTPAEIAARIQAEVSSEHLHQWQKGTPAEWALESQNETVRGDAMAAVEKDTTVTLQELIVSTLAMTDVLAKLLIEKGVITDAEFKEKLLQERGVYQSILNPTTQSFRLIVCHAS